MVAALGFEVEEGSEAEWQVRLMEQRTYASHYIGSPWVYIHFVFSSHLTPFSSTDWLLCIDTNPGDDSRNKTFSSDSEYVADLRRKALKSPDYVVAIIHALEQQWSFEGGKSVVSAGKADVVACREAYRGRPGSQNIMKEMFSMLHERQRSTGNAFSTVSGIPFYCKFFYQ